MLVDLLVERKENLRVAGLSNILTHFDKDVNNHDVLRWIGSSYQPTASNQAFIRKFYSGKNDLTNLLIYRLLKPSDASLNNPVFDKAAQEAEKELAAIERSVVGDVAAPAKPIAKAEAPKPVAGDQEAKKPKDKKEKGTADEPTEAYIKEVHSQRLTRHNRGEKIPISKDKKNVLVTAALPYVNNEPHLGNLIGAILSADVYARFSRLTGKQTMYICGTDEYGTATETKALIEKKTPKEICDHFSALHRQIYQNFDIDFDYFGRTSTEKHSEIVQEIFHRTFDNGFIKEDTLDQLYCETCSRFLADRFVVGTCPNPICQYDKASGDQCDKCQSTFEGTELVNPKCFVCKGPVAMKTSRHFFFDLEKVSPELAKFVEETSNVKGVWTANSNSITQAWFKQGLKPRCITRDLSWGVQVPKEGFKSKCFYVWFDAPIGYISITANFTDQWREWWQNPEVDLYQFMGKDNVPFHTILFPGVLLATRDNWTLLKNISTTEYLNYEDSKFSKRHGVGIFGGDIPHMPFPVEYWRFYLISVRPEGADTQFKWNDFASRINNELSNNFGNLCHRVLSFIYKKYERKVPAFDPSLLTE